MYEIFLSESDLVHERIGNMKHSHQSKTAKSLAKNIQRAYPNITCERVIDSVKAGLPDNPNHLHGSPKISAKFERLIYFAHGQ